MWKLNPVDEKALVYSIKHGGRSALADVGDHKFVLFVIILPRSN